LTVSPSTAAVKSSAMRYGRLRAPMAASVPAAKSSESPGRKGVTTKP
jgi:hypothetical protein